MTELVRYERADSVATITMDDGKANVVSNDMIAQLNQALDRAQADEAAVVLAGREGMFSAGFDLATFKQGGEPLYQMLKGGAQIAGRVMSFPRPVVAACTGHVFAMGVFLSIGADFRIGATGPYKVVCNEVAIGLTLPRFTIEVVRPRLTPAHFNRAMALAETYSPEGAVEAGFLDRVVPVTEVLPEAIKKATALAELNAKAHAESKLLVREQALAALDSAIEAELATFEVYGKTIGRAMKPSR